MKKNISRVAVVALAITTLVAGFGTSAVAAAGTVTTQSNGSLDALHFFVTGVYQAPATELAWTANAIASSSKTTAGQAFACPVGSDDAFTFISARGSESTVSAWKAYAAAGLVSGTTNVSGANLKPSGQGSGTPGAAALQQSGGNFSLGIACTNNNGLTVTGAFFRHIAVTPVTGAWTAVATDYSYGTPTITEARSAKNTTDGRTVLHTGDKLTAAVTNVPFGFDVSYAWYANGSAVSNATNFEYTTVPNDAGKTFTVKATYSRTDYPSVVVESAATRAVEGDAVVSGDTTVSASVADANNGQLSLSIPNNMTTTLSSPTLVNNLSTTVGNLGDVTVVDGRVVTRDGWDLYATATDFSLTGASSTKIAKSQLGINPRIVSRPTDGNAVKGTEATAGTTSYPFTLATSAKYAGQTDGDTVATNVGSTVVNATLTLVAPQWKPSGTYTSTITLRVQSK